MFCLEDRKLRAAAQYCSFVKEVQGKTVTCIFELIWLALLGSCTTSLIRALSLKSSCATDWKWLVWLIPSSVSGQLCSLRLASLCPKSEKFWLVPQRKRKIGNLSKYIICPTLASIKLMPSPWSTQTSSVKVILWFSRPFIVHVKSAQFHSLTMFLGYNSKIKWNHQN